MISLYGFTLLSAYAIILAMGQTDCIAPSSSAIGNRIGLDINTLQQTQMKELFCLEVLEKLITTSWQDEIDKIPVNDLNNIKVKIVIPPFKNEYSNPESEWILDEGMAFQKLDKCVRTQVGRVSSKMDNDEIQCLNTLYTDYLTKEKNVAKWMDSFIAKSSKEQLPFKAFYSYYEMTQLLFDNQNIDALDDELRALHEDMLELYIKDEEDKNKKIFIVEQECQWKNARVLREIINEDARYQKFARQVKENVNRYLAAEMLHEWKPGTAIPDYRYNMWLKSKRSMEREILEKAVELSEQRKDAQYLCSYAAELANKFFLQQKEILFERAQRNAFSAELKTHEKYNYILTVAKELEERKDERLPAAQRLVKEFKEGHYCFTNFVRMIENHQRYTLASALMEEPFLYGNTYCHNKEVATGLVTPRYCKCQGTFCEEFGLATMRAERFNLNITEDNTYKVSTKPGYKVIPMDPLVSSVNQRIANDKFNTWWYRHQHKKNMFVEQAQAET